MDYHSILTNIGKHILLDREETDHFTGQLKPQEVARKELLLKEGERCRYIHFVTGGILRAYYVDKEGKQSTIMFAVTDWWITDMYCFVNGLPAMLTIEAVEDSTVFSLQKEKLDALYTTVPKFERFFRIILQNAYIREQLRIIQNLSLTAEARYDQFLAKYPQVASKVTQKQIASYLGITPEFLSAIRAQKSKR